MIQVHGVRDGVLVSGAELDVLDAGRIAWVDLIDPSDEERAAVVDRFGPVLPVDSAAGEIEATARYQEERDGIRLQLLFLCDEHGRAVNVGAAFALRDRTLVSIHEHDLLAAEQFTQRAAARPELVADGLVSLVGILESKVDHLADSLEAAYAGLEELGRRVLDERQADLGSALLELATVEDRNGKIRINLMDTERVLTSLLRSDKIGESRHRLTEVLRDVESLLAQTSFLLEEISFLSSSVLGLITIDQNRIMKVLSVAAVVFLPPTLVASVYGMNFDHMPELGWVVGYPLALLLMIALGVVPYLVARRRNWA